MDQRNKPEYDASLVFLSRIDRTETGCPSRRVFSPQFARFRNDMVKPARRLAGRIVRLFPVARAEIDFVPSAQPVTVLETTLRELQFLVFQEDPEPSEKLAFITTSARRHPPRPPLTLLTLGRNYRSRMAESTGVKTATARAPCLCRRGSSRSCSHPPAARPIVRRRQANGRGGRGTPDRQP